MASTKSEREKIYKLRKEDENEGTTSWSRIYGIFPHINKNEIRKIYTREQRKREEVKQGHKSHVRDTVGNGDKPPGGAKHQVKFEVDGQHAVATSISPRIKTLSQLLDACEVDLDMWRVDHFLANVWEMGRKRKVVDLRWDNGVMDGFVDDDGDWNLTDLWQVKAWFIPREEYPYEAALDDLITYLDQHVPAFDNIPQLKQSGDYLLVANIYDAHVGRRSYNGEYTIDKASRDFVRGARGLARMAKASGRKFSRVLFPVGHDILHADNIHGTTTKGTAVEMSADLRDAITAICQAIPEAIEILAAVAPVDVVPVESNHDRIQVHWLAQFLGAFFKNHPNVSVVIDRSERQYYQWGRVGLGLTHAATKPPDLANAFAVEARHMWADISWTEWLTGHMHKERGALYAIDSYRGTAIRTIPAFCEADTYEKLHLFVGNHRAAEGLIYHKQNGPAGSFPVFIDEL